MASTNPAVQAPKAKMTTKKPPDEPGDPEHPRTFTKTHETEGLAAAYCGFQDVALLRRFAASFYVVEPWLTVKTLGEGLSVYKAFELLRDTPSAFPKSEEEENNEWPTASDNDDKRQLKLNKSYRLANLLWKMKSNLTEQIEDAQSRQDSAALAFSKSTGDALPHVSVDKLERMPVQSYEGESPLEPFNRLWTTIRYLSYSRSRTIWQNRFAGANWDATKVLGNDHVPRWMRSDKATLDTRFVLVQTDPDLPRKQWKLHWRKESGFNGPRDIPALLLQVDPALIPSANQVADGDPRVLAASQWRDTIRRQFRCLDIGMNIHSLTLQPQDHSATVGSSYSMNLLQSSWPEAQAEFNRIAPQDVFIEILFRPLEEGEELWEGEEPPASIARLVRTEEPDEDTTESATATRGSANDSHLESHEERPETSEGLRPESGTRDGAPLPDLFETLVNGVLPPVPPRRKPDPQRKFPKTSDRAAMMAYYSSHDLTTEKGLNQYQDHVFGIVGGVPPIARVPKRQGVVAGQQLSSEQTRNIEAAEEQGFQAALARGKRQEMSKDQKAQLGAVVKGLKPDSSQSTSQQAGASSASGEGASSKRKSGGQEKAQPKRGRGSGGSKGRGQG